MVQRFSRLDSVWLMLILVVGLANPVYSAFGHPPEAEKDTLEEKRNGFLFIPVLYYTPETGVAGGVAANYYFRERNSQSSSKPSSILPLFVYTQKKQIISLFILDLYLKNENVHLENNINFLKFPDTFYGIGNRTPEENEEDYTPQNFTLEVKFWSRVRSKLYIGVGYDFSDWRLKETEDGGLLSGTYIPGSEGCRTSGIGLLMKWDTRDELFYPSSGYFLQLFSTFYADRLGSDYDFNIYEADIRRYFSLFTSHVIAVQGFIKMTTGDPPFQMLSRLGGPELLRGYYEGRYRDRDMLVFQTEYRLPLWRKFGAVAFAGLGDVASELRSFQTKYGKYAAGVGLRYMLNTKEKINIRFDVAFGKDTSGFYITMLEAF